MFSFFVAFSFSKEYINLTALLGAHHAEYTITKEQELCINITQFPFYIMFYEFPDGLIYHEYYSRSPRRQTNRDVVYDSKNYSAYRAIELPYGSITFSTVKDSVEFRFTYATLPGYCRTGMYMNNAGSDKVSLSPTSKGFNLLGNYDDKCFLFATPIQQTIKIKQISLDPNDRVFLHTSYTAAQTYSGNISKELVWGSDKEPPFVRILTNKGDPPKSLDISLLTASSGASRPETVVHIPRGKAIDCEHEITWYSEDLVIMLIACCVFFAIIFILLIACKISNSRARP
jgi:hypothetical protein